MVGGDFSEGLQIRKRNLRNTIFQDKFMRQLLQTDEIESNGAIEH